MEMDVTNGDDAGLVNETNSVLCSYSPAHIGEKQYTCITEYSDKVEATSSISKKRLRKRSKRRKKGSGHSRPLPRIIVKPLPPPPESRGDWIACPEPVVPKPVTMKEVLASIPGFSIKTRKRGSKKLSTAAQLQQVKEGCIDLESPDSILVNTNIKTLLSKHTFSLLPSLYQYKLGQLLPPVDRPSTSGRLNSSSLNNEFFARACLEWQESLAEGEFTPENQQKIKTEAEKEKSRLDPWKVKNFEPYWGEKFLKTQTIYSSNPERPSLKTTIKLRPTTSITSSSTATHIKMNKLSSSNIHQSVGSVTRSSIKSDDETHSNITVKPIPDLLPISSTIYDQEKKESETMHTITLLDDKNYESNIKPETVFIEDKYGLQYHISNQLEIKSHNKRMSNEDDNIKYQKKVRLEDEESTNEVYSEIEFYSSDTEDHSSILPDPNSELFQNHSDENAGEEQSNNADSKADCVQLINTNYIPCMSINVPVSNTADDLCRLALRENDTECLRSFENNQINKEIKNKLFINENTELIVPDEVVIQELHENRVTFNKLKVESLEEEAKTCSKKLGEENDQSSIKETDENFEMDAKLEKVDQFQKDDTLLVQNCLHYDQHFRDAESFIMQSVGSPSQIIDVAAEVATPIENASIPTMEAVPSQMVVHPEDINQDADATKQIEPSDTTYKALENNFMNSFWIPGEDSKMSSEEENKEGILKVEHYTNDTSNSSESYQSSKESSSDYKPVVNFSMANFINCGRSMKDKGRTKKDSHRSRNRRPPPGAVNLERSYQICQAVIQSSPNREALRSQLKPPPALRVPNSAAKPRMPRTTDLVYKQENRLPNLNQYILVQRAPNLMARASSAPPANHTSTTAQTRCRSVGSEESCTCKLRAMVLCKKCGAFCHDDCLSASDLCLTCLIR